MLDDYVRQLAERGIKDRYDTLSERERGVVQLIAEGNANKEIAEILHLSPSTVETHRAPIMESSTYTAQWKSSCTRSARALFPEPSLITM
jgi:FixJ family two-component response regulator